MAKDYYNILGVERTATQDEIKKAFRHLAHQYHPDKGKGDEKKFKEVNEAYQVLSNEEKRKQYDQFGTTFEQSGFTGSWEDMARAYGPFTKGFNSREGFSGSSFFSNVDLEDILGDFFGFRSAPRSDTRRKSMEHGRDIEVELAVDFREAALGARKKIPMDKLATCARCRGEGAEPGSGKEQCPVCKGDGQVAGTRQTILGTINTYTVCQRCEGSGFVIKKPCSACAGEGVTKKRQTITVEVPGGIEEGQRLKMSGAGEAGKKGGRSGDLYVRVRIAPHPKFERDGEYIRSVERIPFSMAMLGGKANIDTIDGVVKLKIPAGTPSGRVFRLRNRGAKRLHGRGRGDHLVRVEVAVPGKLSKEQKKLIQELRDHGL